VAHVHGKGGDRQGERKKGEKRGENLMKIFKKKGKKEYLRTRAGTLKRGVRCEAVRMVKGGVPT